MLPGAALDAVKEPQVAAVQVAPATVLESVQVTAVFAAPVTCAVNGYSLGAVVVGTTNA